ncbi:DBIRD complex subunit ZNF326 [Enoplosus armatus]|uniref:DBIRD complex subunit ZNF326 n=1 Tax=Enoplosus armatus TaxID=215367 RepID=UPI0039928CF1
MTTTVRLSPPSSQQDYQHQLGYEETGLDQMTPSTEVTTNRSKNIIMDKSPITCDLCDVELANGQELEDHLDSKSHWDTLEHIQQQNNYDDVAIAFLQEVMLYKSHQCSRAIGDSALQALQDNDHMTKIEIFHCAACKVFISTSASSVQTHITSQEHLSNIKEFEVQQRRACLDKAETMMKELKPQFEHFLKGGSPFE